MVLSSESRSVGRDYLMQAFILLGSRKEISRITVTELCQKAGVNRSTFYKYFKDIPDLFDILTREYLDRLFYVPLQENQKGRAANEVLASVLEYSLQERELALLMLNHTDFSRIRRKLFDEFRHLWPDANKSGTGREYLHSAYFFGGMCALWREWLSAPDAIQAQEAANDLQILMNQAMNLRNDIEE